MAAYLWSSFADGDSVPGGGAFSAGADTFEIDNEGISAADIVLEGTDAPTAFTTITFGGKTVTLEQLDPNSITSTNIFFADGSMLLFGDNDTGTGGDDGATTLQGGEGNDQLIGVGGADRLEGNGGDDLFVMYVGSSGKWGNDTIVGGSGTDTLWLADGESTVTGIRAHLGNGTVTGGDGNPSSTLNLSGIENLVGGAFNDTLFGSGVDNLLAGGGGGDRLTGGVGNDTLDGGTGADSLVGGLGDDVYVVNAAADVVTEASDGGTDTVLSSINRTLGNHEENLTLTGVADRNGTGNSLDNVINGNDGANFLDGDSGNDTINGLGGNDTLTGGSGDDSIDGGEGDDSMAGGDGDDRYSVIESGDATLEEADGGTDTIVTNRGIDMTDHANVENLVWLNTGGGGGFCSGNALDNVMSADGGAGTLTMDGNEGSDTVSFAGQAGAVTVDLDLDAGSSNIIEVLLDMENAIGGNNDDSLTGNEVSNRLDGGAGVDTMVGGYGNDTYVVDDLGDVVVETDNVIALVLPGSDPGAAGVAGITDTIQAAITYSLNALAFIENLTLLGTATQGTGNVLANVIKGNALANTLSGLGGNDTLDGLGGADVLSGGAGNDVLIWRVGDTYNGGGGTDTLSLGAGNLNLTTVGQTDLLGLERVDLRGDQNNTLTVTRNDILDMSTVDTITVLGDAGDRVIATGFTAIAESALYVHYSRSGATLLVEKDVAVVT